MGFFCLEERWLQLYEICLLTSSSSHEKALITVVALVILILFSQKKNVYHLGKVLSSVDLFWLAGCFFYRFSNLLFCRFCSVFCKLLWSLESWNCFCII